MHVYIAKRSYNTYGWKRSPLAGYRIHTEPDQNSFIHYWQSRVLHPSVRIAILLSRPILFICKRFVMLCFTHNSHHIFGYSEESLLVTTNFKFSFYGVKARRSSLRVQPLPSTLLSRLLLESSCLQFSGNTVLWRRVIFTRKCSQYNVARTVLAKALIV